MAFCPASLLLGTVGSRPCIDGWRADGRARLKCCEIIMTKTFKSGEKAPCSGQYEIIGRRGGHTHKEVTVVKNEPLPPTRKPGESYRLSDRTKH